MIKTALIGPKPFATSPTHKLYPDYIILFQFLIINCSCSTKVQKNNEYFEG
jgi:hypothetical protein